MWGLGASKATPMPAPVLRLCEAIPKRTKPFTSLYHVIERYSWSRASGVMHGIGQVVLTPMDLLQLFLPANPTKVDVHHFRAMRYNVTLWLLLRFDPTRHRECSAVLV